MRTSEILDCAIAIGREAGELLLGYDGRSLRVERKGRVDLVTEADRASEELILGRIRAAFPDHGILAEESGDAGHSGDAEWQWVIDPLDGTTNFAHGLPLWSVSIGVLRRGEPWVGVVVDPTRGETFAAARGGGATLNGGPIQVSEATELSRALLVTGFPYDIQTSEVDNLGHFANFMKRAQAVRRLGSAAIDLCYVACGRFDGFWELKLHPWDVAAGALLVTEAGGVVTRFDGGPFDIHTDEILAGPEPIVDAMRPVLALGAPSPR